MTRSISVAWVIKGLSRGGAEQLLVNLACVSSEHNLKIQIMNVLGSRDDLAPTLEELGVHVTSIGRDLRSRVTWPIRLIVMVYKQNIDIIHIHSPLPASIVRLLARLIPRRRFRIVYTEHSLWSAYHRLTRLANALTFSLNDVGIAVSDEVRRAMSTRAQNRTRVIFQGVRIDQVEAAATDSDSVRKEFGIANGAVVVGTVGGLRPQKGTEYLLKAAAIALQSNPELHFVIVGGGILEPNLKYLTRQLGIDRSVAFLGVRSDPWRIMDMFDIFVMPSIAEGLPVALMESQVLGIASICTSVGGIPEAVRDNVDGILVAPKDPESLAREIRRLALDGELRRQLAEAARRRSKDFDIQRTMRNYFEVYQSLLDSSITGSVP